VDIPIEHLEELIKVMEYYKLTISDVIDLIQRER
jgi:hypothetical protein